MAQHDIQKNEEEKISNHVIVIVVRGFVHRRWLWHGGVAEKSADARR
jgi:hypothetical protein